MFISEFFIRQIGPIVDSLRHDKAETGARWSDWSSWSSFETCSSVPCQLPATVARQRVCVSISRVAGCQPGPGLVTMSCPANSRPQCLQLAASHRVSTTGTIDNKTATRSFNMPAGGSCLRGDEMISQLRSPRYAEYRCTVSCTFFITLQCMALTV